MNQQEQAKIRHIQFLREQIRRFQNELEYQLSTLPGPVRRQGDKYVSPVKRGKGKGR